MLGKLYGYLGSARASDGSKGEDGGMPMERGQRRRPTRVTNQHGILNWAGANRRLAGQRNRECVWSRMIPYIGYAGRRQLADEMTADTVRACGVSLHLVRVVSNRSDGGLQSHDGPAGLLMSQRYPSNSGQLLTPIATPRRSTPLGPNPTRSLDCTSRNPHAGDSLPQGMGPERREEKQ